MAENYEVTEKYTKKTTPRILKEVLRYREKVSGNLTTDQAYVILMTEWNMECGIEQFGQIVKGYIYKDGDTVHTFEWPKKKAYKERDRDWDWDFVYRAFLEHIIKTKIWKRPKMSKRELNAIKKAEAEAAKKAEKEAKLAAKAAAKQAKLNEEKPKRKRRTKDEMEALRNAQK